MVSEMYRRMRSAVLRIPGLGYAARLVVAILRLPRRLDSIEARLAAVAGNSERSETRSDGPETAGAASPGPFSVSATLYPSLSGQVPELRLEGLLEQYHVTDPVYRGMIAWRVATLQRWALHVLPQQMGAVMEIGTGNFPFTLAIGQRLRSARFLGIETDAGHREAARGHLTGRTAEVEMTGELWNMDLVERRRLHQQFDLITSFEVYEHVPVAQQFSAAVHEALKPGGYYIVETPNTRLTPLFTKVLGYPPDGGGDYEGAAHVNEVGFHQLFAELRDTGFEVLDFDCYYLPFALWQEAKLPRSDQRQLHELVHMAAREVPFYSYVQMWLARRR